SICNHRRAEFGKRETIARDSRALPQKLKATRAVGIHSKLCCIIGAQDACDNLFIGIAIDGCCCPDDPCPRSIAICRERKHPARHSSQPLHSCGRSFITTSQVRDLSCVIELPRAQIFILSPVEEHFAMLCTIPKQW